MHERVVLADEAYTTWMDDNEGFPVSSSRVDSSNMAKRGHIELPGLREKISSSSGSK